MENLIIYGGSFDPIHNGHLRIARAASLAYNADVLFVPAQTPRWKEPEASAEQRVEMLRLALKENGGPSFSIDLIEINEISEVNYTVNTIKSLKKKFKDKRFAAGCSREIITKGAEMLDWELDRLLSDTLKAMQDSETEIKENYKEITGEEL